MENSKIEWTQHTFSPWHGCAKVSPGCKNCYADAQHNFHYSSLKTQQGTCWGVAAPRLAVSADTWKKPHQWNRAAAAAGVRARVFCASMADVFEPQGALSASFAGQTAEVPKGGGRTRTVRFVDVAAERLRLLRLIYDTPHLDWLLLTKRPENIKMALQQALVDATVHLNSQAVSEGHFVFCEWLSKWALVSTPPANVWLGTSVENQEQADARIPHLLAAPAAVRFLSCEPLLGPVSLDAWLKPQNIHVSASREFWNNPASKAALSEVIAKAMGQTCGLHWVIVGGESGPKARPMHPQWAESLRDQCQAAGVAYFFKQWGEWGPTEAIYAMYPGKAIIPARLGYKLHDFTPGLIKRSMDDVENEHIIAWKLGKHAAGRLLSGREWNEVPTPQSTTLR
jgi:protein gp37